MSLLRPGRRLDAGGLHRSVGPGDGDGGRGCRGGRTEQLRSSSARSRQDKQPDAQTRPDEFGRFPEVDQGGVEGQDREEEYLGRSLQPQWYGVDALGIPASLSSEMERSAVQG